MKWVWSSKMNWLASWPARYFDISMSAASASETFQTGPNTLFIARNAVAMPALVARNWRRLRLWRLA